MTTFTALTEVDTINAAALEAPALEDEGLDSLTADLIEDGDVPEGFKALTMEDTARAIHRIQRELMGVIRQYERQPDMQAEHYSQGCLVAMEAVPAGYKGQGNLDGFLKTIFRRVCTHHIRRQTTRKEKVGLVYSHEVSQGRDDEGFSPVDELGHGSAVQLDVARAQDPATITEHRRLLDRMSTVLKNIQEESPTAYRTWDLYFMQERSYMEICEELGIRDVTARGHVHRIEEKIKAATAGLKRDYYGN